MQEPQHISDLENPNSLPHTLLRHQLYNDWGNYNILQKSYIFYTD